MALANEKANTDLIIRTLHPAIGAEVRGVEFSKPLSYEQIDAIQAAWMKHHVLVFPSQEITDEQHVAVTRQFGEPEIFHQNIIKSKFVKEIFRVANTDEDGNVMPMSDPIQQQLSSAKKWHTDSSYRPIPALGSMLHGVEVSRTGGLTCFTNMHAVYEALPAAWKKKVEGRKALHDFDKLSRISGARKQSDQNGSVLPPIWQPMVRSHPVTGRKSLYISPIYNDHIEGMEEAKATAFIEELAEFASQDQFVYRHKWETDDIILWDNRCTMHIVTPHDPTERRVMHRTTIVGDGPVIAA